MTAKRKIQKYLSFALMIFTALALTFVGNRANAQVFAVNFVGNAIDNVTGNAGAVPVSGWNNINNTTYITGTINSSTDVSFATLTITSGNWSWHSGTPNDGANGSLLDGYADAGNQGNTGTITAAVTGLTDGQLFDVYVYTQGDSGHLGDNNWLPNYGINGTTYYTATTSPSGSTLIQGQTQLTNSNTLPPLTAGNYIRIQNVVATGGVITIVAEADAANTFRSPFDGFQLVAVPEPTTSAILAVGLGLLAVTYRFRRPGTEFRPIC